MDNNKILQRVVVRMIVGVVLVGALLAPSVVGSQDPDQGPHGKKKDNPGKGPPGSEPVPTSFRFDGPYDVTTFTNTCAEEPRCQPTGFTPDGHLQVRVENGDVTPPPAYASEEYRVSRFQFVHTMLVPYAVASMNVTMVLNITSALAETVATVDEGYAYIQMDMIAEHIDCVDMWCRGQARAFPVEAGRGFCCLPHEHGPTSRSNEVLEIPMVITNHYGAEMPPGRVRLTMDVLALVDAGDAQHLLRPLGDRVTLAMDATIDEIRIDIVPAAGSTE